VNSWSEILIFVIEGFDLMGFTLIIPAWNRFSLHAIIPCSEHYFSDYCKGLLNDGF
jgi:hypothetical protein